MTFGIVGVAVAVLAIFVVLPVAIRACLVEATLIPSEAMRPTLQLGDQVLVWKRGAPRRGEVVLLRYPADPEIDFVKRIVAIAGDTIELRGERLLINGTAVPVEDTDLPCAAEAGSCRIVREQIDENVHHIQLASTRGPDAPRVTVPAGHFYVLGDNRNATEDSRTWGSIPNANYRGTAFLLWGSTNPTDPTRSTWMLRRIR